MSKPNLLRDKTLVLRILDERLQSHLREKMLALEESASNEASKNNTNNGHGKQRPQHQQLGSSSSNLQEARICDLEGVTCEPAIQSAPASSGGVSVSANANGSSTNEEDSHTLWNFHVDGATYPARLTNLPCPIEIHKTHDHAMYYKCVDVAQMLIVYEDMTALEEAESMAGYRVDGFPSYYHSGLTPPMTKVVSRRFKQREHVSVPPPFEEVQEVEQYLMELIQSISTKDPNKNKPGRGNASISTKVLEEIDDEIVDYEPWMDDYGRTPKGIEFSERDAICKAHPEIWLDPDECKSDEQDDDGLAPPKPAKDKETQKKSKKKSATADGSKTEKKTKKKKPKKTKTAPSEEKASTKSTKIRPKSASPAPPVDTSAGRPPSTITDIGGLDEFDMNLDIDNFDVDLEGFGDIDLEELEL